MRMNAPPIIRGYKRGRHWLAVYIFTALLLFSIALAWMIKFPVQQDPYSVGFANGYTQAGVDAGFNGKIAAPILKTESQSNQYVSGFQNGYHRGQLAIIKATEEAVKIQRKIDDLP